MSQNHLNYMSGVPVKISESYKPPKKLALNQSVSQRLSTSSNVTTQILEKNVYDFSMERTVLAKMSEWQHVRQHEKCDRKERFQIYQQERQSLFDAKQKQILTAVSYPSTDDLSSDDDSGHDTSAISLKTVSIPVAQTNRPKQQQFSPPNYFNSILLPTVMPGQKNVQIKQNVTSTKTPHHSKINFQEFESDTSSPFDNVELKTINDLDILAEVWNTSVAINNTGSKDHTPPNDEPPTNNLKKEQAFVNGPLNSNSFNHSRAINAQQNQTNTKQMNHSDATANNSTIPITNSYYVNQLHYHIDPNQLYSLANQTYRNSTINNNSSYAVTQNPYASSNYISPSYNNQTAAVGMPSHINVAPTTSIYGDKTVIENKNSIQTKSKSKSVSEIVEDINTEIQNSQGKRVRNNSEST